MAMTPQSKNTLLKAIQKEHQSVILKITTLYHLGPDKSGYRHPTSLRTETAYMTEYLSESYMRIW